MIKISDFAVIIFLLAAACSANAAIDRIEVRPTDIDHELATASGPHVIFRDKDESQAPLLIFLPGTGGETVVTAKTERAFIDTALAEGYRVIILSYIDTPAVAQVCTLQVLAHDPACTEKIRQKRIFGDDTTGLINDRAKDAIVPRLTMLLNHLAKSDAQGHWEKYLEGDRPRWSSIVLSGQSQGGGMAAFLAKRYLVAGVIDFSGGWDMRSRTQIATWYAASGATPSQRLFGTFHVKERFAKQIAASYEAMQFPADHQFALDKPVRNPAANNPGHGEGASNPAYKEIWAAILSQFLPHKQPN